MRDLEKISGLALSLEGVRLRFGEGVTEVSPDVRLIDEFVTVSAPDGELTGPREVYYMYRGVCKPDDRKIFLGNDYRYDITILRPGTVGRELVKTVGHYHPPVPGTEVTYPEVYEVLSGKAHYLCQKAKGHVVTDFFVVEANPGDKVVIPPNYGHITINPGQEPLVMSNVTADGFSSIYEPLARMRGAAFYGFPGGRWELNSNYEVKSPPKWASARQVEEFNLLEDIPLYTSITSNPEKFDFLINPQRYQDVFAETIELGDTLAVKW